MSQPVNLRSQIMADVKSNKRQYDIVLNDPETASGDLRHFYELYYKVYNSDNALFEHDRAHHALMKTAIDSLRG